MTDREKVIKAVEYLNWYFTQDDGTADKNAVKAWEVLLQEQEPVKPKWTDFEDSFTGEKFKLYHCGNCGSYLFSDALYCPICGRKVKRDDAE